MAEILAAAPQAKFFSPAVTDIDRLATLIATAEVASAETGDDHGADAYGRVLHVLAARREPGALIASRTQILRTERVIVIALSPTDWAIRRGMAAVGRELHTDAALDSAASALTPNLTSAAIWIESPTHTVLLGADLECHPEYGWERAISETQSARGSGRATLLKVPHHGSVDADDPTMWDALMDPEPDAVLTPFGLNLPRDSDLKRLSEQAGRVQIAAGPTWSRWTTVVGMIASAIPNARVDGRTEIGYVRYRAVKTGWAAETGTL